MENGPSLTAFVVASVLLAVTPGPGVLYIVARTLAQGRAAGLASVAGVAVGNVLDAAAAALGLAALFAVWSSAFLVVKLAGAGYLVWLGVRMWRTPAETDAVMSASVAVAPLGRLWFDGLAVALLNPKTALFFAAFLPQFIDAHEPSLGQTLRLGALFALIAATSDAVYVVAASVIAPRLAKRRGTALLGRRASAAALVALGMLTVFTDPRRPA